ncbi:MAG: tetratricopeptide repeat protein, partial [Rickettsiales bacterium]|nr:tetratricopeptide repeat protein [Rickettsiales bacterium]
MKLAVNAMQKNKGQEALDMFKQVVALNPDHAEALYYIGFILHSAGNYEPAANFYQRAMHADPLHLNSYLMLCKVLEAQNRGLEAIQLAHHAAQIMPQEAETHCQLASTLLRFNNAHTVPAYLESILPQFPNHVELRQFYCIALKANNRFEEADAVYETLTATHRVPATFRMIYETLLPRLYQSSAHIDAVRDSFAKSIATFTAEKPQIDLGMLSNYPLFELAYHNRDNKELIKSYTRMLRLIAPSLNYVAPHCKAALAKRDGPIRIGFLSAHMHNHSVGNSYRTLMLHLAAQPEFLVTFFNLSNVMDEKIQTLIDAGLPIISLPKNITAAHETVAKHTLDILIYPDIGMDAMTHYMAMARLAPHQVCLGGHPETTGIDTIDYMIGSRSYEPPHAADNYTERLLCVDGVNTISTRTPAPERWLTRAELGLPTDKKLYVCPMAIQKFHPDYD